MSKLRRKIGNRIVKLREEEEMTQAELSDEAGVSLGYLSGIENGRRNMSIDQLEKIADALGYEVKELLP